MKPAQLLGYAVGFLQGLETLLAAAAQVATRLIDDMQLFRRLGMGMALYVTHTSIEFCYRYAGTAHTQEQMVGAAAVIAAIMAPVGAMQAALFKFYVDSSTRGLRRRGLQKPDTPAE